MQNPAPRGPGFAFWLTVASYSFRLGDRLIIPNARGRVRSDGISFFNPGYGPGRIRAEKGAADAGTVHPYCEGHSGSVEGFRQIAVRL